MEQPTKQKAVNLHYPLFHDPILNSINQSLSENLEPAMKKLTVAKDFLIYADWEGMVGEDNLGDIQVGIDLIMDEVLEAYGRLEDCIAGIYQTGGKEGGA